MANEGTKNMKGRPSKTKKLNSGPKETSGESSKKASMKTASDVISRLLWDESLDAEKFTVGYLDRFVGTIEKPFASLDWSHPDSVDYNTFVIPKHRICYFKYRNRKMWDKAKRLDIIFGSLGYPFNIYEVMQQVDHEKDNFQEENGNSSDSNQTDSDNEGNHDNLGRPNYFIAIRIHNKHAVGNLQVVADNIKLEDSMLSECCIPSEKYHLTLNVLKIDSPDELDDVISTMKSIAEKKLPTITLTLEGLDDFRQRVLFAKVDFNSELLNLRNILTEEFSARNLKIADRFSFVPHVTVAKLSRTISKIRHSRYIDQYLYLKFEDNHFGSQQIDSLYLCEMGSAVRDDGFYNCAAEVSLS